jgi:ABC-type oligopeptide transport system substrate-binding subunit
MTTRTLLKTLALTAALGLSVTACGSNSGSSSNGTAAPVLVTA